MAHRWTISLMDKIAPEGLQRLKRSRMFQVRAEAANPHAIIVRSRKLAEKVLDGSNLCCIARAGSGVDNIPVAGATSKGIPVFNAPGANANAVKEAVIGAMIALSRNFLPASIRLREGGAVDRKRFVGSEIAGRTLGIIGLGQIGQRVANAAVRVGMRVVGYDKYLSVQGALRLPPEIVVADDLDTILEEADIITLHANLTDETRGMINARSIRKMKNGVRIINFARGDLVEAADMRKALDANRVVGYATDFPDDAYRGCERVLMTPHIGASTREAQVNCAEMAAEAVAEFLLHGAVRHSVNFPNLQLQRSRGACRLVYANENIPGMISKVSAMLAKAKVNIIGMANQSRENIGYSIVDCSLPPKASVIKAIRAVDGILMVRKLDGE